MTAEMERFLAVLGRDPIERLSINHLNGRFRSTITTVGAAPALAAHHAELDSWYGTAVLHSRVTHGRGTAADVVGIRELYADLDVKPGGLPDYDMAWQVIHDLSDLLGARPAAVVHSGHGLQPHWAIQRGPGTDWTDETSPEHAAATALWQQWGQLVATVADRYGGAVDGVWDLSRVLRIPGTVNCKEPAAPVPVTVDYLSGSPVPLIRLRAVLLDMAIEASQTAEEEPKPAPGGVPTGTVPEGFVRAEVATLIGMLAGLRGLPEGGRIDWYDESIGWDKAALYAAGRLIQAAHSGSSYTLADAQSDFLAHAPVSGGTYDRDHKWAEALKYPPNRQPMRYESPADVFGPVPAESADGQAVRDRFPLLDVVGLLNPDRPPRAWLWDGIVPQGDHVSLVAPPGVGKSLLVLALVVAIVRGDSTFIGRALAFGARAKVLYIDMENSEDDWAERLADLGVTQAEASALVGARFLPLSLPRLAGLDTERGARDLVQIIDAYGLVAGDAVVLDSTQRVTEGEENSNDTMRRLYDLTSAELKRRGLTVIRTDNTGHDKSRERGASAKRDDVGYAWLLKVEDEPDTLTLKQSKNRSRGSLQVLTFQRVTNEDGRLVFVHAGNTHASQVQQVVELLNELGLPTSAGYRAAGEALKKAKRNVSRNLLREAIRNRKGPAEEFEDEDAGDDET